MYNYVHENLWLSHDLIGAALNSACLLLQWIAVNHVQCTFFVRKIALYARVIHIFWALFIVNSLVGGHEDDSSIIHKALGKLTQLWNIHHFPRRFP